MKAWKILLFTSCYLVSHLSMAMQVLSDDNLSTTTAQDGLTITLKDFTPNAQVIWTDTDGISANSGLDRSNLGLTTNAQAGSVIFGDGTRQGNFRASTGNTVITMDADGGNNAPFVNINIALPADLTIHTGNVYVAGRDASNQIINQTKIMQDMQVELGGMNLNVQMGNAPQGNFVNFAGTLNNGLKLSNFGLIANNNGTNDVGIGIGQMTIRDNGQASSLSLNGIGASITNAGLSFNVSGSKSVDVIMQDVKVGNLANNDKAVGGIAILGLDLSGKSLTISGH